MIKFAEFRYSESQWYAIKAVVRDEFDLDADKAIGRRTIEYAATTYLPRSAINRQRLRRDKLEAIHKSAENLRIRIIRALAVQIDIKDVGPRTFPEHGVDDDMLAATSDYFTKLLRNLDHQIKKAGTRKRRDNARKTNRDEYWTMLLLLWRHIGGELSGRAAARFLIAASKPVGIKAKMEMVLRWLDRHKETVSKILQEVPAVGPARSPAPDYIANQDKQGL